MLVRCRPIPSPARQPLRALVGAQVFGGLAPSGRRKVQVCRPPSLASLVGDHAAGVIVPPWDVRSHVGPWAMAGAGDGRGVRR